MAKEDWREEEEAEYRHRVRYQMKLLRHPSCRDPDHPGCERCEPIMDEEE